MLTLGTPEIHTQRLLPPATETESVEPHHLLLRFGGCNYGHLDGGWNTWTCWSTEKISTKKKEWFGATTWTVVDANGSDISYRSSEKLLELF